jgi:formylglycine-generating enzyme required for sulfatase activity
MFSSHSYCKRPSSGVGASRLRGGYILLGILGLSICSGANRTKRDDRDGQVYVWIPPGTYQACCSPGDAECFRWEAAAHEVAVSAGFWIGQTEVTQRAYQRVLRTNPSRYRGLAFPADQISWNDVRRYCTAIGMPRIFG